MNDPIDTAKRVVGFISQRTDTPQRGILVLGIALYAFWQSYNQGQPLEEFLKDFTAAMQDLHQRNQTQGPVQ